MRDIEELKQAYIHKRPTTGGQWEFELLVSTDRQTFAVQRRQPVSDLGVMLTTWRGPASELRQAFANATHVSKNERRIQLDGCTSCIRKDDTLGTAVIGSVMLDLPYAIYTAVRIELSGVVVN